MEGQEIVITIRKSSTEANQHFGSIHLDGTLIATAEEQGSVTVLEKLKKEMISKNVAIANDWLTKYRI